MSTIKANTIEAADSNTDLVVQGSGSGVPNIETGFKVSGTAGVPTADIRDDAVTGAKLNPAFVAGDIIYADGTDTINRLAKGTAAQVLQMNAGATAPEWATAGGGTWEPVSLTTVTAGSSVASVEFTGLSGSYDAYKIEIFSMTPSTDNVDFYLRVTDDGGSTWESSQIYQYASFGVFANHTDMRTDADHDGLSSGTQKTTTGFEFGENLSGYTNREGVNITMEIFLTGIDKTTENDFGALWIMQGGAASVNSCYVGSGGIANPERLNEIDGVQLIMSSGNIEQGKFYLSRRATS